MRPRTHFGIVTLVALAGLIAAPHSASSEGRGVVSWPQRGYDPAHLGFNPLETTLGTANVAQLVQKWHASIGSVDSSAIEADGKLFVTTFTNDSTLYVLDEATGTTLWSFSNGGQNSGINTPAVANGRVFVGMDNFLYSLDEATGAFQWRQTIGIATPITAFTNGPTTILYVGGGYTVYAIDGSNGHVIWSQSPDPPLAIQVTPTVGNGLVYVADDDDVLHAYDMQSGVEAWSVPLPVARSSVPTDVALDGGTLYVGEYGRLFAVNALDGTLLWYQDASVDSNLAVAYGMVYVETQGTYPSPVRLFAFRKSDGAIRWRAKVGSGNVGGFNAGPSVANGVVYASSIEGGVAAYDASDGTPLWRDLTIDIADGSPAVVNGMVFVTSFAGVYAYGLP